MILRTTYRKSFYSLLLLITVTSFCFTSRANTDYTDSMHFSTAGEALLYIDSVGKLDKSSLWPNVDPNQFLENLRHFATKPLNFYEGKRTNFCSYSALTYIPLKYDPLGFSRFMIKLYKTGRAKMGKIEFHPGKAVRDEVGLLRYKGALDISPAGQMWFLCLASYFKGYLNIFNRHYDKGDENTLWASTNFAKFNRMLRKLFYLKTRARGSDLIRPWINDEYSFLQEKMKDNIVFLYLNNRLLYNKKHIVTRLGIPTHYVLLMELSKTESGLINIVYWDYGRKTLQQLAPKFLHQIVYGITFCELKDK